MDYPSLSALEIANLVAAREVSAAEVVEAAFARIDAVNEPVNAIVWRREEAARADARAADGHLSSGAPARPLEGVPFTVKDLCATTDGPMNLGSRAFEGLRPGIDATIVTRLKHAGAILIATTTSSEFGARPTTESELFGPTRNPWNLERTSGGSSGGGGVAAALGMAPLNQGSDGGGSVRIPAACCGVYGLKTARGRISLGPILSEEWGGLDVYGPLTRTVRDAAAFLDAAAGPATGDPYWAPPPERSFLSACDEHRPLRIAVAFERDGEAVDPACTAATERAAEYLHAQGHTIVEAAPELKSLEESFVTVTTVGIGAIPLNEHQFALLEPRNQLIVQVAREIGAIDYERALHTMRRNCRHALAFFEDYDALLTPTISRPAPAIGTIGSGIETAWDDYRNWLCWTWPFNVTGQPAASVPAGLSPDGLPVGVQVVGRSADERTVLMLSEQLARAHPWDQPRPPIW